MTKNVDLCVRVLSTGTQFLQIRIIYVVWMDMNTLDSVVMCSDDRDVCLCGCVKFAIKNIKVSNCVMLG